MTNRNGEDRFRKLFITMKRLLLLCLCFSVTSAALFAQNFTEDFESGELPEGFTIINGDGLIPADEGDIGWADTAWIVTTSTTFDGFAILSISWYEDENGNEVGPADDWLILPKLEVSENSVFEFDVKSSTSSGDFPDDYQVLVNPGEATIEDFESNGAILFSMQDEASDDFVSRSVDLSDYAGQEIFIAVRNVTNTNGYGLWIDNLRVTDVTSTSAVAPEVFEMAVSPNPTEGASVLNYTLPRAAATRIVVTDLLGREVMRLDNGVQTAGAQAVPLDLTAQSAGVYLVSLYTDKEVSTLRLQK